MNGVNAVKGTDPLPDRMSAEIVVIGSGPGGAVTAALCAEAGRSVLLVEEGENLPLEAAPQFRSEEHTSELQSLMRISYAVFCLKKKTRTSSLVQHTHLGQRRQRAAVLQAVS